MKPVRRSGGTMSWVLSATAIVVIIGLVVAVLWLANPGNIFKKNDVEPTATEKIIEIPSEDAQVINQQLESGALLTFGNKEKGKPVALFIDPDELSRDKPFINGRPSDFLTAVQKGEIYLSLYLVPSSEDRAEYVNSVTHAAKCRQMVDRSSTSIYTLNAIVATHEKLQGNSSASVSDIVRSMGADLSSCPTNVDELVKQSSNNAYYFLNNVFGIEGNEAMAANNSVVTNLEELRSGWVDAMANNDANLSILVPNDDKTETVYEVNTGSN